MSHAHCWAVTSYTLLSLPTTEGFSERLTSWHCTTCSAWCDITGEVKHRFPLKSRHSWIARRPGNPAAARPPARPGPRRGAPHEPAGGLDRDRRLG